MSVMIDLDAIQSREYQDLHCTKCSDWLKLERIKFNEKLDGIQFLIDKLPVLVCPKCSEIYLPIRTRIFLQSMIKQAHEKGASGFQGILKDNCFQMKFNYCKKVDFEYDATDYYYIPGLWRHTDDGGLTPVFFDRKILQKFRSDPDYTIEQFSDTYGTIYYNEQWDIAFGITRNSKVICWLCDLDELPEKEQQYFKAFNVISDHDIASAFYKAQIEAEWASLSNEAKLFQQIDSINQLLKMKFDIELLKKPDPERYQNISRPIFWDRDNVLLVVNSLNQICIESIRVSILRSKIIKKEPDFVAANLKGLKLLEKWLELYCPKLSAEIIMKPLFVLYDFRQVLAHNTGSNEEAILQSCYERMAICDHSVENLYDSIVKGISNSYYKLIQSFSVDETTFPGCPPP